MSSNEPVSGYDEQQNTANGAVYFYSGEAAGNAVSASLTLAQIALEQQQQNSAQQMAKAFARSPSLVVDPITIATVVAAIAGTVGAVAAVGGTAAAVGSLATGVAGTAMSFAASSGDDPLAPAEILIRNDTLVPVIPTTYSNGGCSVASYCMPMMPGSSSNVDLLQPNGFDKGDSYFTQNFRVGALAFQDPETSGLTSANTTSAKVRLNFNDDGDWVPAYKVDDMSSFWNNSGQGTTAIYFRPNDSSKMVGFTIISGFLQKSTGAMQIVFLPGSEQIV